VTVPDPISEQEIIDKLTGPKIYCPIDRERMFKRIYVIIDHGSDSDQRMTTWRCRKCDAEATAFNGVPLLFDAHGRMLAYQSHNALVYRK
jgi:hypothetical protein